MACAHVSLTWCCCSDFFHSSLSMSLSDACQESVSVCVCVCEMCMCVCARVRERDVWMDGWMLPNMCVGEVLECLTGGAQLCGMLCPCLISSAPGRRSRRAWPSGWLMLLPRRPPKATNSHTPVQFKGKRRFCDRIALGASSKRSYRPSCRTHHTSTPTAVSCTMPHKTQV